MVDLYKIVENEDDVWTPVMISNIQMKVKTIIVVIKVIRKSKTRFLKCRLPIPQFFGSH